MEVRLMFVPTIDRSVPLTFIPGVPYGAADGVPLPLDVLCPHGGATTRRPAAIWLHGGGWAGGSREEGISYWCALMASHGFVTVSVDYRLSGDAVFPAPIHDVKAAIRWLRANAEVYHIDQERIGIWGHSAGGHLAALAGVTGDLAELEGVSGAAGYSSRVQAVAMASAPSDFLSPTGQMRQYVEHESPVTQLFGGTLIEREDLMRLGSPIAHVSRNAPPFLIAHGTLDETVPFEQAERFAQALVSTGSQVDLVVREGAYHNWNDTPDPTYPKVRYFEFAPLALAFFQRHLGH